jgi:hypothetical protein
VGANEMPPGLAMSSLAHLKAWPYQRYPFGSHLCGMVALRLMSSVIDVE